LKDFYSIESNDLFPKKLLSEEIFPMLATQHKDQLKEQSFYKNASEFRKIVDEKNENSHLHMSFNATSVELLESEYEILADMGVLIFFYSIQFIFFNKL
jgi:hypothetical protein